MLTTVTLLLAASLAPGHAEGLSLTNARTTYGILGPERPNNKFLPGDLAVISFDIKGAQADAKGKVLYSIAMEITSGDGKSQFKQAPRDQEAKLADGATSLPA